MQKSTLFIVLMFCGTVSFGQNIRVTFTGTGAATRIDSIKATNLRTRQSVTFPGDQTLYLTLPTGIPSVFQAKETGMVFPNPFQGTTNLTTLVASARMVEVKIQNLIGQTVAQLKAFVQPGLNRFTFSVKTEGVYIVSCATDSGTDSYKVICTHASSPENSAQYLGSETGQHIFPDGPASADNISRSLLKSSQKINSLAFQPGDLIRYCCQSGIYTTLLTNSPDASQNFEVKFVACTDPDGRNYSVVNIGNQTWMAENLAWLPDVSPSSQGSETTPINYVYDYQGTSVTEAKATSNFKTYGVLYNWPSTMAGASSSDRNPSGIRGICPSGWHVPSDAEWRVLTDTLGTCAGGKMKETGASHWLVPNYGSTNESGFTALPGGFKSLDGYFLTIGNYSLFWSSTENEEWNAWRYLMYFGDGEVGRLDFSKSYGFSVRCIFVAGLPTVTTADVREITRSSATSGGMITDDGGVLVSARGVCWSVTSNPTTSGDKTSDGTGGGEFTSLLTGLTGNTTYYVRAYATNSEGTSYGNEISFKTSPLPPVLTTAEISLITQTTASSGGTVTDDGGADVTSRGVCWATSIHPTTGDSKTTDGTGIGPFTSQLTGLTGNTTYYLRAYAINSEGTTYGNEVSFTTSPLQPGLSTTEISSITQTTASSGGNVTDDGGADVSARGVCWSTSVNPTIAGNKTSDGTGLGPFTSLLTGLTGNTTYYVRAYATNSAGTSYGNEISFRTSPVLPNLVTTAISEITQTTAASGGQITSDGGADITARGVCWSTEANPTTDKSKTLDGTGTGIFISSLTGLTGNTTYYVRAYATNSAGTSYGKELSFKTSPVISSITTAEVSDITQTSATCGGNVTDDGGADITDRGVCWSVSPIPTTNDSKTSDGEGTGEFTSNLTGLTGNTTYYVRAYAINSVGSSYGNEVSFKTRPVLPTVTTKVISAITQTTASCGGTVTSDGGAIVTARGVCWSTSASPTITDSKTSDGTGSGVFTSSLTGLTGNTTYHVRAYATSSAGTSYGNEISFKTSPVPATVTTQVVSAITQTTASSGGTITDDGGAGIIARGVCWSTSETPTTDDSKTVDGTGIGVFTSSLTGLTGNTTYYVRAYATNSAGTSYGNEASFKTISVLPTVTTRVISDITQTTASTGGTVTDDGGTSITARGVCWSTSAAPTTEDSKTSDGTGTGVFTSNLTGLTGNTTYYVRAYAINSVGTNYGNEVSFTTSPVPATVTTQAISGISQTTATTGGMVTDDGGASITARGVCWSTSSDPTTDDSKTSDGAGTGVFTSSLTGLTGNTTYYVRAYAINSVGTSYGNQVSFKTSPVQATVITQVITAITQTTATTGGTITDDGGAGIIDRGVCWSTSSDPTTNDSKTSDGAGTGVFTSSLTGLTGNTTYYVRAYAINSVGISYGNQVIFKTSPVPPSLVTESISDITQTTAASGGTITDDGGSAILVRGVCWSDVANPTTADSKTTDGGGSGSFTSNLEGLTGNTYYYVRAYATNSAGTSYGNEIIFRTGALPPTVVTASVSSITQTTAIAGGTITSDGGAEIIARGVCWSVSPDPTTSDSKTTEGTGSGSFTSVLTGLSGHTLYYVRCYATNSAGTSYGNEVSFFTSPVLPTINTLAVAGITQSTAISGGNITSDGGADINVRGVCWSTLENPTILDNKTSDGAGTGSFTSNLTGLTRSTTYYARAYATSSVGTSYGGEISFTTLQTIPSLTTIGVSGITQTTAFTGGFITDDGGAVITAQGVCWSVTPNPTLADSKTDEGAGPGFFISSLTGLTGNTTYYVRAYATNIVGTGYGDEANFKTSPVPPTVETSPTSLITPTTASAGGNVTGDGGSDVIARGICWSNAPNPTLANSKTSDGTGTGPFESTMTGLFSSTAYYYRAYATSSAGTSYGEEIEFTTLEASGSFIDSRDARIYHWVTIGTQRWMAENLAYLPSVSPSSEISETMPYYYVYGYEGSNVTEAKATTNYTTYGVLTNWEAAKDACPSGWHLPSDAEWTILTDYLITNGYGYGGSGSDIGKSMAATAGWTYYATPGTIGNIQITNNRSGFKALPAGYHGGSDGFFGLGNYTYFWSATEFGSVGAWFRSLHYSAADVNRSFTSKSGGFSIRCIQD